MAAAVTGAAYLASLNTAREQVLEDSPEIPREAALNRESYDRAVAAGVTHSEYVNYEEGLANYASRDDVEPLAERRARDIGLVADQTFRRKGAGSAAPLTSPADGNNNTTTAEVVGGE